LARKLNGRDAYKKAELLMSGMVSFPTKVLMSTRKGSLRAGYMNKLARLSKKIPAQIFSETSGKRIRDRIL
jgi:hypothetical protein